jgi:hypothetical protein
MTHIIVTKYTSRNVTSVLKMSSCNESLIYEFSLLCLVSVQQADRVNTTVPLVTYEDVPSMSKQAQKSLLDTHFHSSPLSVLKFLHTCQYKCIQSVCHLT